MLFLVDNRLFYVGLHTLEPHISKKNTRWRRAIRSDIRVLAYLLYVCQGMTYIQIGEQLAIGTTSACKCVHECVYAVCRYMFSRYIHLPNIAEARISMEKWKQKTNIPGIVGALDGTHITIKKPCEYGESYWNRKSQYSINVQGSNSLFV